MDRFAALEPEYRGRGSGGRVLDGLECELAGRAGEIELGVEPGNAHARALYERRGFAVVGERLGFLLMRKPV